MSADDPNAELKTSRWPNRTPLHRQRREAAERVRIARTIAAAFPSDENTAELVEAMEAFKKLTGREGFEQMGKVPK